MSFLTTYRALFEVHLYHHYFLDNGAIAFDSSATLKAEQLEKYNFNSYLRIVPSLKTQRILEGQRLIVKNSPKGISVWGKVEETAPSSGIYKPFISLAQSQKLQFLLYVTDSLFENYSTIEANPLRPLYFSNKKPITEGGSFQYIDKEDTTSGVELYTITEDSFEEIEKGLTHYERIGLFGIISLEMAGDDTVPWDGNSRNILNTDGTLPGSIPTYKIQFLNRSTIWNYINPVDNSLIHSSDPTTLPLVKHGIIAYNFGGKERPSAQPNRIVYEKDGSGTIIKTISEIFIN